MMYLINNFNKRMVIISLVSIVSCVLIFAVCLAVIRFFFGFDLKNSVEIHSIVINNMAVPLEKGGQTGILVSAQNEFEKNAIIEMINDLRVKRKTHELDEIGESPNITVDCYNQHGEEVYSLYFYGSLVTCDGGGVFSAGEYIMEDSEYEKIHEICREYGNV